jgi:chromosome segregation ATPase
MDDVNKRLDLINDKLEEHTKILSSVDKTLALQAQQLEQHMKRTDIAEENLAMLRGELKPLERHVELVNSLVKGVSLVGAAAAGVYYTLKIFGKL